MNIVFLDVDYVLNSYRKSKEIYELTGKRHSGKDFPFDEVCLNNLKYLIDETNSYIVISSSWRKYEDHMVVLRKKLIEYGLFDRVIGVTEVLGDRILEIRNFLKGINCKFVILDDIADLRELNNYLICTNAKYGLSFDDVSKAIRILKK